jgi:cobyrinic acid a,c-diamide synthase
MPRFPRIAVGTIQREAKSRTILWALMEALRQSGFQVQSFLSQACFPGCHGATTLTGLPPRHLDSWLMSPETCREVFVRGAKSADLALVQGEYDAAVPQQTGGRLETLCRWLNLPRLVVFDAVVGDRHGLPERPARVDGLLLDRVSNSGHFARLATDLEALWGVPVLGSLERLPRLRARLEALPEGERPPQRWCQQLGEHFARSWQPEQIWRLAVGREFPRGGADSSSSDLACSKLTVAIAYDEAFHCYFEDTLDLLELRGASAVDFSPLRDESLPPETDLVYLGCGHPERFAAALSENHCMKAALRSHLAAGRRIYAEGGGAAYLCQQMETPAGELKRMVGIFPAVARWKPAPTRPAPVEVTLTRPNWLAKAETRLRGYRNRRWDVEPLGLLTGFVAEEPHRYDLVGSFRAIGSMLHLDFAARPSLLDRFFYVREPQPSFPDPWAAVL